MLHRLSIKVLVLFIFIYKFSFQLERNYSNEKHVDDWGEILL